MSVKEKTSSKSTYSIRHSTESARAQERSSRSIFARVYRGIKWKIEMVEQLVLYHKQRRNKFGNLAKADTSICRWDFFFSAVFSDAKQESKRRRERSRNFSCRPIGRLYCDNWSTVRCITVKHCCRCCYCKRERERERALSLNLPRNLTAVDTASQHYYYSRIIANKLARTHFFLSLSLPISAVIST